MASLPASLPRYMSHVPPRHTHHLHDLCVFPRNLSLTKQGSVRELRIATSSNQTEPLIDSTDKLSDIPLLSCSEAIEKLKQNRENYKGKQQFLAMYSSIFGGIITDAAAMVIPVDDHMVHRGHGVFDTAAIMDGYLYELDQHLDRIIRSASMAKIVLPFDRETIRRILVKTVSASKCIKGSLRYWISAGPGDFHLSPSGCYQPALYAIVIEDQSLFDSKGIKVVTSSVPIKPPRFASMKSVNYLPNVLSKMEAEEKEGLVRDGKLHGIRVDNVSVEEGKRADEMMLIGSGVLVRPVVQWDEQVIGDGKEGPISQMLLNFILEDMKSGPSSVRVPVPY
ncbi:D-amino-acid transaminase, chloroplastic isoform X2 [Herrania umbratica]|uniref:D-amino-acid transaminase, chloroplastic isoform X2 n=1 Tax=Herrania umbratica TaxID=108875 RepID=A0A6J0ZPI8_9ROSI|nr:D-amino-acid transaminase, chloroplastic isoform X2 [Herrania umbratica]